MKKRLTMLICFSLMGCVSLGTKRSWNKKEQPPVSQRIQGILSENKKVRLLIMGEAKSIYSWGILEEKDKRDWEIGVSKLVGAEIETEAIKTFSGYKDFQVIERALLETILSEQGLSLTGAVTEETAIKAGKLTGASHLIYWNYVKSPHQGFWGEEKGKRTKTVKFIDLETGNVLASQWVEEK